MRHAIILTMLFAVAGMCRADEPTVLTGSASSADTSVAPKTKQEGKPAAKTGRAAKPASEGAADKGKAAASSDEEAKPVVRPLLLDVGWADWNFSGNNKKFQQYATPPSGFFIGDLRLEKTSFADGVQSLASFRGNDVDNVLDGRVDALHGMLRVDGFYAHNRFYEITPLDLGPSDRRIHEVTARGLLSRNFGLNVIYRMDQQDLVYVPPAESLHQRTRFTEVSSEGNIGNGRVGLSYTDWAYFDRTGVLPNTTVHRLQASAVVEPSPSLSFDAQYAVRWIKQAGEAGSSTDSVRLGGDWAVGGSSDLTMNLRRDSYKLPNTQSAVLREQFMGSTAFLTRWPGWSLRLDANYREAQRLNGDQTRLDVPRWWTLGGRLSGRLTRQIRLTVRGSSEHMSNRPLATTDDTDGLSWSSRDTAQVKLDGSFKDLTGYTVYTYKRLENVDRGTTLQADFFTAGANWQVNRRLSLFAQWDYEWWSGNATVVGPPSFQNFLPDSRVASAGLSWSIGSATSLLASLTDYVTNNDNPLLLQDGNIHGQSISITLQHRLPSGYEFGLTVAPWIYRDRVVSLMDYTATVVSVTAKGRF